MAAKYEAILTGSMWNSAGGGPAEGVEVEVVMKSSFDIPFNKRYRVTITPLSDE